MPSPYYYYVFPFGQNADDLTAIPTNAAVDGSVSYFAGWTDPYEFDLTTNPAALPIPRGQMNQLFFDITNNIQEYQQFGTPQWVVGNTVAYPIYSRVYYLGVVYESRIASNTNTPGTDSTWRIVSNNQQGVPVGAIIDFATPVPPAGYLACDGSAVNRTTYADLYSAIVNNQTGTLTNTMTSVTGLTDTSSFYVGMKIEGTGIPPGTIVATIPTSTSITISNPATASGPQSLFFYYWGNGDGSTTFNVPDARRRVAMGTGGSPSTDPLGIGNKVGQKGGEESHAQTINELASHNHNNTLTYSSVTGNQATAAQGGASAGQLGAIVNGFTGSSQAFNVIQPSMITFKAIKYI